MTKLRAERREFDGSEYMVVVDQDGVPLPGQSVVTVECRAGEPWRVTVEFVMPNGEVGS